MTAELKAEAARLGFDLCGVAPAVVPPGLPSFLNWLDSGSAGEMRYLSDRRDAYAHPDAILAGVRSVVMLGLNYNTRPPGSTNPAGEHLAQPESRGDEPGIPARVAQYAIGERDYHDTIRARLKQLQTFLRNRAPGCRSRGIVDTAPLLERDFARLAGLGWFGKNTMLINRRLGSWLFLAALLTDLELDTDTPHNAAHCGSCTRCLEACPTHAFTAPYVLDARRCIAYLTIELRAGMPAELRPGVADWLFGCDVCQAVCPWNRKAPVTRDPAFEPRADLRPADALAILELDEPAFHARFGATPLARPRRSGLLRNAAIVAGNAGDARAVPVLIRRLGDADPVVRGAAAWALGTIGNADARHALEQHRLLEQNPEVCEEVAAALRCVSPRVWD